MPIHLHYVPHPAQRSIHCARDKRFRTVCTGRRFGKTMCLAAEVLDRGSHEAAGDYGWIAPTSNVADRGIEAFRQISSGFIEISGRAPCRVEFTGKMGLVKIWFLSADNPDTIRGFGFQGIVIDEAASIPVAAWHYAIRPTISQTLGWAVFVSTPKGRNWFYDLFTRGNDPSEKDYASFTFPSNASPFFPQVEWEEARRTLPEDVFRQEYMAEFMEDSAGVFRGIDGCLLKVVGGGWEVEGAEYHRNVVIGCDVAKHTDWPIQKERITDFAQRYPGRLILDATGVGDPILDDLRHVVPDIEGFKLTAGSKTELIQRLIVAVEQRQVSWPSGRESQRISHRGGEFAEKISPQLRPSALDPRLSAVTPLSFPLEFPDLAANSDWPLLTAEMKRFEYSIGPTGNVFYGAPSGFHDDCVIALALANYGRWNAGSCGRMLRIPGGPFRGAFLRRKDRTINA